MDAIQSATAVAAELLRISGEVGTLEAGMLADVIAVEGDPLDDISILQDVAFVMKEGIVYKFDSSDSDGAKAAPPSLET